MKNIYLLPTSKPTRGLVLLDSRYRIEKGLINYPKYLYPDAEGYDVYITSDEEIEDDNWFIKEGDWYIDDANQVRKSIISDKKYWSVRKDYKKIILTTDQDLIEKGVQEIPDEFLEWFVKNHTCKFVEVKQLLSNNGNAFFGYKIITPKEKQKQLLSEMMQEDEKSGLYDETIEQAAERLYPTTINSFTDSGFDKSETERLIFKNGAKWQQEQNKNLYSEEDMIEFADFYYQYKELIKLNNWETIEVSKEYVFKKWIEQLITL